MFDAGFFATVAFSVVGVSLTSSRAFSPAWRETFLASNSRIAGSMIFLAAFTSSFFTYKKSDPLHSGL